MIRQLLVRGMLVGLAAGLLAFPVAYALGEPPVQAAIDFEEAHAAPGPSEPEVVSRGTQRSIGLLTGLVVMGVALGGLFALVFAWAYGRIGPYGARATAALLALGAWLTVVVVPFTKYPANPPATGAPETIGSRTALFVAMISISIVAVVAAGRIRRRLEPRLGAWNAAIAAVASFVALVVVAQLILPAVDEVPAGFPADVLWDFRVASLAIGATLWAAIGLGFGVVAQRLLAARAEPRAARVPAGA